MFRPATLSLLIATQAATASSNCGADAMLVFDGSGSMAEIGLEASTPRIIDARTAIARALPQVEAFRDLGLLVYGPGALGGCANIDLRFAPEPHAADKIIRAVDALAPGGMTPLSASVAQAAEVLNYRSQPATIVLVTDGNETCGGTPCALGRQLQAEGADLTVHVIGFKFRFDFFGWDNPEQSATGGDTVAKCLSDETGGTYVSTETVDELVEALNATLGCALIGALPQRKTALPKEGRLVSVGGQTG
jgi:Ca-activated chloride channel family protein